MRSRGAVCTPSWWQPGMGATPAAPVAAGVAFSWRSSRAGSLGYGSASNLTHWWSPPGYDKRNSTGVERASDRHSAQTVGSLMRRWMTTCRTWNRMQRAERLPLAVQHPELPRPESIAGGALRDTDRAGFQRVGMAWPGRRGGPGREESCGHAQHQQGAHPYRTKRAFPEQPSSSPAATRPDATSRARGRGAQAESAQLRAGNACDYPPGPGSPAELKNEMFSPTPVLAAELGDFRRFKRAAPPRCPSQRPPSTRLTRWRPSCQP